MTDEYKVSHRTFDTGVNKATVALARMRRVEQSREVDVEVSGSKRGSFRKQTWKFQEADVEVSGSRQRTAQTHSALAC